MIKFINRKKLLKITAVTLSILVLALLPFTFAGSTNKSITKPHNKLNSQFQAGVKRSEFVSVKNNEINKPKKTKVIKQNILSINRNAKLIDPNKTKLSNLNKVGSYLTLAHNSVDEYVGSHGKKLSDSLLNRNDKNANIRISPHNYISEFRYDFIIYPNKLSAALNSGNPLGLTSGINNVNVNGIVPSVPEPHEYVMFVVGLAMMYFRLKSYNSHLRICKSRPNYV